MNSNRTQLDPSRLQTPREDRTALVEPPADDVPELVAENLRNQSHLHDYDVQGRSLAEVSRQARTELLAAARNWTAAYRNIATQPLDPNGAIYLAGHQPQMFHPGVWFKTALGTLAKRDGATAINLIIDGDTLSDTSVRVPGGSVAEPHAAPIPFDWPDPNIPYEDRKIEDRELFASFGRRAIERISPLVVDPLVERYWPLVRARRGNPTTWARVWRRLATGWRAIGDWTLWRFRRVGCAWARHSSGSRRICWRGCRNFARLTTNRCVNTAGASRAKRLASAPDLAEDGPWLESPLWVWTADNPRRRRLFARIISGEIFLSDRQSWEARLPLNAEGDAGRAVERLMELQPPACESVPGARDHALGTIGPGRSVHPRHRRRQVRLRDRSVDRAVLPTCRRLGSWWSRPRCICPSSAIARRPTTFERSNMNSAHDAPARSGIWREMSPPVEAMIAEKRRWIATPQTIENARQRCQAIRRINTALQPWVADRRRQSADRLAEASRRLAAESVLASREYAFCLYPEATLRGFLSQLLRAIA